VVDRKTSRVTFDVKAMKMLQKTYPADLLYAVVGEFRAYQKILGTYIGITEYEEVPVSDTYVLREGERWKDAIQRPSKKK
jgi:hypothetical protein